MGKFVGIIYKKNKKPKPRNENSQRGLDNSILVVG
jgi:hypothetical protein